MKKIALLLAGLSLLFTACGPTTPVSNEEFQAAGASKIEEVQLTQEDLSKDFAEYQIVTEKNDSRYGLGGREVFLTAEEENVFRIRYMSFPSQASLEENFEAIGEADDMKKAGYGKEAYKTDARKKISFRKDGVKMDVTVMQAFFDEHDMKEVEDLADLMLSKF